MTASAPNVEEGAMRSVSLHQGVQQLIANREADLVDELVLAYRSGKIAYEHLLSKVAAVSELRTLEASLDRAAKRAIEAATGANAK